jgi:hypothetical protein
MSSSLSFLIPSLLVPRKKKQIFSLYGTVRYGTVRYGTVGYGTIPYRTVLYVKQRGGIQKF